MSLTFPVCGMSILMPKDLAPLPRLLRNSGEMMAQKTFVFIIKILRRRKEAVTSQQTSVGGWGGRGREHDVPLASWSSQLTYTHWGPGHHSVAPSPSPSSPEEHPSPSPSPLTAQTISQSCLNPLALPLKATTASSSSSPRSPRARLGL